MTTLPVPRPRSSLLARLVGLVVAAAAGAGGCGDDGSLGGGGQGPVGPTFASTECGSCALSACAESIDACRADPSCTAYLACLVDCPTDDHGNARAECDAACAAENDSSEASTLVAELGACRYFGAGAACESCDIPVTPQSTVLNQVCEPRDEEPPSACTACHWEHCCNTWDACFAEGVNPECDALLSCLQACGEPYQPCFGGCFDDHPDSVGTLLAQVSCASYNCPVEQTNCDASRRDACDVCIYETCADPYVELLSTAEGFLLNTCLSDCSLSEAFEACTDACMEAFPSAEPLAIVWLECLSFNCGDC